MSFSLDLQRKRTHVPIRFGRSLLMVRPLRAGTSSASPQGVERPVNGCTQAFHRTAWTPLENRGKIVDTNRSSRSRATHSLDLLGLALFFVDAGVDRAVEVVFLKLAFDVGA